MGAKLCQELNVEDTAGRWMTYYLAQLITEASGETPLSADDRIRIVELILRLWTNRRSLPPPTPGRTHDLVLACLERLGDDKPYTYSNLQRFAQDLQDPQVNGLPLLETARSLERLCRMSVAVLVVHALREADSREGEWTDLAKSIEEDSLKSESSSIELIRRRLAAFLAEESDDGDAPETDPMSEHMMRQAETLRDMASQLNAIAESLTQAPPSANAPAKG